MNETPKESTQESTAIVSDDATADVSDEKVQETPEVTPLANPSFVGFVLTQFFGAFNDNLFKQLLLLLALPTAEAVQKAAQEGQTAGGDMQGIATVIFGLPFIFFSGFAGHLSDRFSKRTVIVLSKVAEIGVMVLGLVGFWFATTLGFAGMWFVLFLMGLQSTFFGPAKYGILPEMLNENQLSRANGFTLMMTFLAIIFGTALAGPLKENLMNERPAAVAAADPIANDAAAEDPAVPAMANEKENAVAGRLDSARGLWPGALVCIAIAIVGTLTSLLIRQVSPAEPDSKLTLSGLLVPTEIRRLLMVDRQLLLALGASCVFWLIAGLTLQAVNSLGKVQLELSDGTTSFLVALISVGLAAGAVSAGLLSRGGRENLVVQIGMWVVVVTSAIMAITLPGGQHMLGFYGTVVALILLGAAAAFFAIPIQVFLQQRPPAELKGRMIAVMNISNFIAIVGSGVVYIILNALIENLNWPRSFMFCAMAIMFLPIAI
ncbi:MAG: MFS transporter, partial [Planctomycetota bacterium]